MAEQADTDWSGELSEGERAAVFAWADADPSPGFADAVVDAWSREAQPSARPACVPSSRSRVPWVAVAAAVAASVAVLWLARSNTATGSPIARASACEQAVGPATPLGERLAEAGAPAAQGEQPPDYGEAIAALVEHCSPCHDGAGAGARAEALSVFDLSQRQPFATTSPAQLEQTAQHMQRLGGASSAQRRSVAAFVRGELQVRHHAG